MAMTRVWWIFALACASTAWLSACASSAPTRPSAVATHYAADGGNAAPLAPDLARNVREAGSEHGATLRSDPRLDRLAAWAAADPAGAAPEHLEFVARQLGLYDPHFALVLQPALGSAQLMAAVTNLLSSQQLTHFGAAWHVANGERRAAVVLTQRRIRIDALPNSVALGAGLRLRAHLPDGFSHARAELISSAGRTVVPLGAARELSLQLPTRRAGLHRLAVIADGAQGDEILAKLPIYVGEPFPRTRRFEPTPARDVDGQAVALAIFASINRERAKLGLPLLLRDSRLDGLALQHNGDMRSHDFIGHTSARTGSPTQRVAQIGLPTALVLETIARAHAPAALEANTASPAGELRNLLSTSVTHVGIGVTAEHDAHGPLWVATELFVELPERVELASAKPRLLSLVNEARVRRGAPTIALDAGLSAVANKAAERFLRDPSQSEQTVLAETDRELSRFSLGYRRVHSLLVVARHLQDAAALEAGLDPAASGLGIGIAQGERVGTAVLAVVMLIGTRTQQ